MTSPSPPDYYSILSIPPTATPSQIRTAYKLAALKTHPDRLPPTSPDRPSHTRAFQLANDAYYTLSDPSRRSAYDASRRAHTPAPPPPEPRDDDFADVFEEMLREEGMAEPPGAGAGAGGRFWAVVGALAGAAVGFIVADLPGAAAGVLAGNGLGRVRDARGKSVYAVYQGLPQGDRARVLGQLAARVLAHAVGGMSGA